MFSEPGRANTEASSVAALFLASFFACFAARFSSSFRSRFIFAIVVFLLLPAMRIQSLWVFSLPLSDG
jgi:hypothetical protein